MEKDTMNNFNKEKLTLGKFIAHGSFGAVYEGDYDGQKVAIKFLDFGDNRQEEAAFRQEASVWSSLNHPNVAKFIGATQLKFSVVDMNQLAKKSLNKTPKLDDHQEPEKKLYWCMISEFLEGGTLESYLLERRRKKLPLTTLIRLALDIARGLAYLHSQKFVHRDVKSTNMVLDGQGRVKLIDFGVARKEASNPSEMTGNTGTNAYMAPEVQKRCPYDHKCDVFSFGICLWEMFYCRMVEIAPTSSAKPMVGYDCPQKLADLMHRCWSEIEMRPEMAEVLETLEEMMAVEEAKESSDQKKFKGCFSCFG